MTDAVMATPVAGRSLWGDAWARLKANRAAMFSLYYLVAMAVVCVVGPYFVPHQYTTIYADYVRTAPSLSSYPKADMIETALAEAVKRMRVDVKEWHQRVNAYSLLSPRQRRSTSATRAISIVPTHSTMPRWRANPPMAWK